MSKQESGILRQLNTLTLHVYPESDSKSTTLVGLFLEFAYFGGKRAFFEGFRVHSDFHVFLLKSARATSKAADLLHLIV